MIVSQISALIRDLPKDKPIFIEDNKPRVNDVTTNNIVSDELTSLLHISFVQCPNCLAYSLNNKSSVQYRTEL